MEYRGYQMHTTDKSKPVVCDLPFIRTTWMDAIHEDKVCRVIVDSAEDYEFNKEQCVQWLARHYPEPTPEPVDVVITKPKTKYKPVLKVGG